MSVGGITLDDALIQIQSNSSPVLCLDTCALLDVLRTVIPERIPGAPLVEDGRRILRAVKTKHLWLVLTEIVDLELTSNMTTVKAEATRAIKRQLVDVAKTLAVFDHFYPLTGVEKWSGAQHPSQLNGLPDELEKFINDLRAESLTLSCDSDCANSARARLLRGDPPAHAKGEYKDCEIFEHYLELARRLAPSNRAIVFASSNSRDFDTREPSLQAALAAASLKFLPSITDARGFFGL